MVKTVAVKSASAPKKPTVAKSPVKSPIKPAAKKTVAKSASNPPTVSVSVKDKVKKPRLVRDSFTMPEPEYAVLGTVKKMCMKAGVDVKKSQLLRIGVAALQKMEIGALKKALASLAPLQAGRPKKEK